MKNLVLDIGQKNDDICSFDNISTQKRFIILSVDCFLRHHAKKAVYIPRSGMFVPFRFTL
ncbi:hypothetical protein GCM10011403_10210 [Pseudohongiella nitratireducens]|uniref:Uncharacterized protein n=1 Tax=Pseudohongiella nitratireducens TaxID=1768907 RepID=A0A917GRW0_9GAMM|nr:hypothetical protein GCM10011403_10210 [Pseudohongiella nitratireducens]